MQASVPGPTELFAVVEDCRVDACDGHKVDDVAHLGVYIDEVDRFAQTHLDWTYRLADSHLKHEAVSGVGSGEVGEHECVDLTTDELVEGEDFVACLAIEGVVHLHLAVDGELGVEFVHTVDDVVHLGALGVGVGTEVGVGHHCHDRVVGKEFDSVGRETCDVEEGILGHLAVDP